MPCIRTKVECPVHDSFRVQQVAAMFDVPLARRSAAEFAVEIPAVDEDWQIGAIVGPSGSGKSTIAKAAFPGLIYEAGDWPADKAVVDGFEASARDTARMLTAVGFSSPPSWIKPYAVLSNGEKFRCDLARSLLSDVPVVVYDEYSSVVDRVVAQIGSAAVAKAIRGGKLKRKFVAVSCHYDITPWLECDWVVDMATCQLARGRLRRPAIRLEVVRCERAAWELFRRHHYLSSTLHATSQCYLALWEGQPVAFCGIQANFGHKNHWRISRVVTLPDYQGIGIGSHLLEWVAREWKAKGCRVSITASHPAIIRHLEKTPTWRIMRINKTGNSAHGGASHETTGHTRAPAISAGRAVVAFEYKGGPNRGRLIAAAERFAGLADTSAATGQAPSTPE